MTEDNNEENTNEKSTKFIPRIANRETPNTRLFEEVWELHHLDKYQNKISSKDENKDPKQ